MRDDHATTGYGRDGRCEERVLYIIVREGGHCIKTRFGCTIGVMGALHLYALHGAGACVFLLYHTTCLKGKYTRRNHIIACLISI